MTDARSTQGARHVRFGRGFTLIELLVVMAILALLLSIAAPRYFDSLERAKEAALKGNLVLLRDSIDKYRSDTNTYPESFQALVDRRYVRAIPIDPFTDLPETWIAVRHPDGVTPGIYDVRSGAVGNGRDGRPYSSW